MNPQAQELNETIKNTNSTVSELLSEKGKAIFFPKKGILSQSADAKGKNINATIGIALEEDGTPMRLKSIADKISLEPENIFPYAPSYGVPDLRKQWKEMQFKKNPALDGKAISLPIVTNAMTHGLSILGYMFIDPNDKIIIPDLFWGNYKLILSNAYGAEFDTFSTFSDDGFNINGLEEKLNTGTGKKIVLLNFPNNPTGYSPTEDEAVKIKDVIKASAEKGNKILVITDDAYFGLIYKDGIYRESLFSKLCDVHENVLAVKLDGATKEDYVWGLRVGFITYGIKNNSQELYEALEAKTAGAVRGSISNDSKLSQSLVYNAFSEPSYRDEKKEKYDILKKRYDLVQQTLTEHKEYEDEFKALPNNSGYFMCIQLINHEGEKVRQILLNNFSTGVIAMGNILRIAFSSVKTEQIPELFDNIYKACKEA